jgi:ABC-type lipoprotein export system ATPase subunit
MINKQFNKNPNIIHLHFVANDYHQTLLIVTHGSTLAEISNRSIEMEDGRITKQ